MLNILAKILVAVVFTLISGMAWAQAPPPSSNIPGVPLDGLTSILLVAGAGYGMLQMRNSTSK